MISFFRVRPMQIIIIPMQIYANRNRKIRKSLNYSI